MALTKKTQLQDMQVGDYIPCRYTATSGVAGYFSELGTCVATEIPATGSATPNGLFNFIKVDKGLLIADRVVQTGISWDTLNTAKMIDCSEEFYSFLKLFNNSYAFNKVAMSVNDKIINTYFNIRQEAAGGRFTLNHPDLSIDNDDIINIYYTDYNDTVPYGSDLYNRVSIVGEQYINSRNVYQNPVSPFYNQITAFHDSTWHDWKITIDMANKTVTVLKDNVSSAVGGFTANVDTKYFIELGSYGYITTSEYLRNCKFKNIKIEKNGVVIFDTVNNIGTGTIEPKFIRSLSGGCAYADANGNLSLTDQSKGAYPTINEWDKYIVNSDLKGNITKADNNIWHYNINCWCKDTCITQIGLNTQRSNRGSVGTGWGTSNLTGANNGFRPVLQYIENGSKATTLFY